MPSDIGKYTPLMRIVDYFLDQYSKQGLYDKDRIWVIALRGLTELHYDIAAEPVTVRIPIPSDGNKTVPFPNGCLDWVKIGLLNEHGEIVTLKINNSLTTWNDKNFDRLSHLTADVNNSIGELSQAPIYLNYFYSGDFYDLYGVGGGLIQYGECRVDSGKGLVILNPSFQYDHIMFEYLPSPQRGDDYQVLTSLQEAVIAFIEWKLKLNTETNFYNEERKSRRRLDKKKVRLQSINQVLRESDAQKLRS